MTLPQVAIDQCSTTVRRPFVEDGGPVALLGWGAPPYPLGYSEHGADSAWGAEITAQIALLYFWGWGW
jgi:hypothetical protein